MSAKGTLFFTRCQIEVYAQGAACDLDAALSDPNLDWSDKAPLFVEALADLRRIVHAERVLERQRINASLPAMAVYLQLHGDEIASEPFRTASLGFALYDIGMAGVSPLLIAKRQRLTPPEQRTVQETPNGRRTFWPAST